MLLCDLSLEVSDVGPAYIAEDTKLTSGRSVQRGEGGGVAKLSEKLKDREPASQLSREEMEPEPPKKRLALLLMGSESDANVHFSFKTHPFCYVHAWCPYYSGVFKPLKWSIF